MSEWIIIIADFRGRTLGGKSICQICQNEHSDRGGPCTLPAQMGIQIGSAIRPPVVGLAQILGAASDSNNIPFTSGVSGSKIMLRCNNYTPIVVA